MQRALLQRIARTYMIITRVPLASQVIPCHAQKLTELEFQFV